MPSQGPEKAILTDQDLQDTLSLTEQPKADTLIVVSVDEVPRPIVPYKYKVINDPGEMPPGIQAFTPSSMLKWGQMEIKFFQQLYSQTHFFDAAGQRQAQGFRSNYYSGIFNLVLGYNARLNFGMDAWLQSVLIDTDLGSPFKLFQTPRQYDGRTALSALGPKIKWQPFRKINGLTIQSSFLFPVAKDLPGRTNGRPYLATDNFLWWTQSFYTRRLAQKWQLFAELDIYWNINRRLHPQSAGFLASPASVFLNFFPNNRFTFYAMNQFWPSYGGKLFSSWWYQAALGGKYRISQSLDLELMYGRFLAGRSAAGPATAFNFGIRYIHW